MMLFNIVKKKKLSCSSVGRASVLWAEGLGFEPQRENTGARLQMLTYSK